MTAWQINTREAGQLWPGVITLRVPSTPLGFALQLCKRQRLTVDSRLPEDFVAELAALEFPRTAVSGGIR